MLRGKKRKEKKIVQQNTIQLASSTNSSLGDDRIQVQPLLELEDTIAVVLFALASHFVALLLFTSLRAR